VFWIARWHTADGNCTGISDTGNNVWTPIFGVGAVGTPQLADNGAYSYQIWSASVSSNTGYSNVTVTYSTTMTYPFAYGTAFYSTSGAAFTAQAAATTGVPGSSPDIVAAAGGLLFAYIFVFNQSLSTPSGWTSQFSNNYDYIFYVAPTTAGSWNINIPGGPSVPYGSAIIYQPPPVPVTISGLNFGGNKNKNMGSGGDKVVALGNGGGAPRPTTGQIYP
jgi:hypothetical protein